MLTNRWLAAGLVVAATLAPAGAGAFTLFGQPNLLSPGQIEILPFTFLGEQVAPRLDLNGLVRYQTLGMRLGGVTTGLMVPEVNLEPNLQLTATQRIHGLWRPLEQGFRKPTNYQFEPDNTGWTVRSTGEPARLWYEGQPLNWLTPNDEFPLDVSVAGGRLPLIFHNGIWFNNTFDGFAISKNNLQIGNPANINLIYFLTRGQTQGGLTDAAKLEARKNVMGLVATADWSEYFLEVSWGLSYDNNRTRRFPTDLDRNFWGISVTRTFGTTSITGRVLGSTGNDSRGAGALFVLEGQTEFLGVQAYATTFGGTADWLPVTQEGSTLSRLGILFTFDRLTAFPGLNPRGSDSVGGVFGVIFKPRGIITFTPEVGWIIDRSSQGNDQFGAAFQIQADLAGLMVPGTTSADTARRGLLYGLLARLTLIEVHNENADPGKKHDDFGARLEMIYRF